MTLSPSTGPHMGSRASSQGSPKNSPEGLAPSPLSQTEHRAVGSKPHLLNLQMPTAPGPQEEAAARRVQPVCQQVSKLRPDPGLQPLGTGNGVSLGSERLCYTARRHPSGATQLGPLSPGWGAGRVCWPRDQTKCWHSETLRAAAVPQCNVLCT